MDSAPYEDLYIRTNGVTLHAVGAGPPDGPLAILLHGFPEFWYGWRHQIPALARAGYRVIAPDLRGYAWSDKPPGVGSYSLDVLGADVLGIVRALGRERAFLAGHDWGAAVGWWIGVRHPERLERLAILNVPHPSVMARTLRSDPEQLLRSAYILYFSLPWLPEATLSAGGFRGLRRALVASSRPDAFDARDLERYVASWSQPGAVSGMLRPYRAALRHPPSLAEGRVRVPTLVIWGVRDRFLKARMARASLDLCDDGRLVLLDEATHWLQHEEPEDVNDMLSDFFGGGMA